MKKKLTVPRVLSGFHLKFTLGSQGPVSVSGVAKYINHVLRASPLALKRPSNWGKMIPINNASKYHRTVAVYTATVLFLPQFEGRFKHFPLVIRIIHTSHSFLQKQQQQFFSDERYSSVIINSSLTPIWFFHFAFCFLLFSMTTFLQLGVYNTVQIKFISRKTNAFCNNCDDYVLLRQGNTVNVTQFNELISYLCPGRRPSA